MGFYGTLEAAQSRRRNANRLLCDRKNRYVAAAKEGSGLLIKNLFYNNFIFFLNLKKY
jgi:hypothetical protein